MIASLEHNLQLVRQRMVAACVGAERPVQAVTLLAVSKTFPAEPSRCWR